MHLPKISSNILPVCCYIHEQVTRVSCHLYRYISSILSSTVDCIICALMEDRELWPLFAVWLLLPQTLPLHNLMRSYPLCEFCRKWASCKLDLNCLLQDFSYRKGDWLVFGSETSGLPPDAILDCESETLGGGKLKIPMVDTYVRCLNLSVSVGIAVYEASRQLNYEQLQLPSESSLHYDQPIFTEDIFGWCKFIWFVNDKPTVEDWRTSQNCLLFYFSVSNPMFQNPSGVIGGIYLYRCLETPSWCSHRKFLSLLPSSGRTAS